MLTLPEWCIYVISIHASRKGSDAKAVTEVVIDTVFQSTLPAREATIQVIRFNQCMAISIHASRKGSDRRVKLSPDGRTNRHGFREPGF